MNEIEKLKLHLKQAMEIAEANIEKAENIDLVDMAQTLESFIDELNDIGDFETYGELDEGFIRMNQLAGVITENQARKMMEILNEEVKLPQVGDEFSYPEENDNKIQVTKVDDQYVYARSKTKDNKEYMIGLTSWEDKITKGKITK